MNHMPISRFQVAIKVAIDKKSKDEMLHEAKNMARIAKNEHIVNLQGIALHKKKIYLLLEYCANGSVNTYLKKHAIYFQQRVQENSDYEFLLSSLSNQEEMDKNWRETTTKMYMNRTEWFPIFSPKKALILTQEGKEYLYSHVVRIHES